MKAYFDSKYYSELQRVKRFNTRVINTATEDLNFLKKEVKYFYEEADASTSNGQASFRLLNETRDKIRLLKKMIKNMETQQRLVKTEMHRIVMNYRFDRAFGDWDTLYTSS